MSEFARIEHHPYSRIEFDGVEQTTSLVQTCSRINAAHRARIDMVIKGMISKEWALEAIRGRHSLCGDPVFFQEAEKIIQERVDEAVKDALERAARLAETCHFPFGKESDNRNLRDIIAVEIRRLAGSGGK